MCSSFRIHQARGLLLSDGLFVGLVSGLNLGSSLGVDALEGLLEEICDSYGALLGYSVSSLSTMLYE